jgi:hypothetical protein
MKVKPFNPLGKKVKSNKLKAKTKTEKLDKLIKLTFKK